MGPQALQAAKQNAFRRSIRIKLFTLELLLAEYNKRGMADNDNEIAQCNSLISRMESALSLNQGWMPAAEDRADLDWHHSSMEKAVSMTQVQSTVRRVQRIQSNVQLGREISQAEGWGRVKVLPANAHDGMPEFWRNVLSSNDPEKLFPEEDTGARRSCKVAEGRGEAAGPVSGATHDLRPKSETAGESSQRQPLPLATRYGASDEGGFRGTSRGSTSLQLSGSAPGPLSGAELLPAMSLAPARPRGPLGRSLSKSGPSMEEGALLPGAAPKLGHGALLPAASLAPSGSSAMTQTQRG